MALLQADFYAMLETLSGFDGVATDPPYKGSTASNSPVKGRLNEQDFDAREFLAAAERVTLPDSFLISFGNFPNASETKEAAKGTSWEWCCTQVWDKRPTRRWVSKALPLKHVEYISYFTRGRFRLDFRTGEIKPAVRRSSFGGGLMASRPNTKEFSEGMREEIVTMPVPRGQIRSHACQKPAGFSAMFAAIVGGPHRRVLDPYCGSGALLGAFPNSTGIDLWPWWNPATLCVVCGGRGKIKRTRCEPCQGSGRTW